MNHPTIALDLDKLRITLDNPGPRRACWTPLSHQPWQLLGWSGEAVISIFLMTMQGGETSICVVYEYVDSPHKVERAIVPTKDISTHINRLISDLLES